MVVLLGHGGWWVVCGRFCFRVDEMIGMSVFYFVFGVYR